MTGTVLKFPIFFKRKIRQHLGKKVLQNLKVFREKLWKKLKKKQILYITIQMHREIQQELNRKHKKKMRKKNKPENRAGEASPDL